VTALDPLMVALSVGGAKGYRVEERGVRTARCFSWCSCVSVPVILVVILP